MKWCEPSSPAVEAARFTIRGLGLAVTKKSEKGLSRRDAHKLKTRTTLRDAALDLFLAQGYDATTTDQVAAKACVSTRTFFRYFDSKDEVLFSGQRFWSEKVADMLRQALEKHKAANQAP